MIDIKLKIRKMEDEKISKALNVAIDILTKLLEADEDSSEYENFSERYRPVKQEITKFDENSKISSYFTQFRYGCLLFSLVNGKFINESLLKNLKKDEDFTIITDRKINKINIIRGVIYEYKALKIWKVLSGVDAYLGNIKDIEHRLKKMLEKTSLDEVYKIAIEIRSFYRKNEEFFSIKTNGTKKLDFACGQWRLKTLEAKFLSLAETERESKSKLKYLKHLPKFSLVCDRFQHWRGFLGVIGDKFIFCDSLYKNKYVVFEASDVTKNIISVLVKQGGIL